jgi:hypothetical protein
MAGVGIPIPTMTAHDDAASIAANTEASIAGSSVAVTEAEDDASSLAAGGVGVGAVLNNNDDVNIINDQEGTMKVLLMTRASSCSLDISLGNDDDDNAVAVAAKDDEDKDADEDEEEAYAAPMHLHALRAPAKLRGVPRSRSSSRSRPGSRRNSSSPPSRNLSGTALSELVIVGAGGLSSTVVSPSASVGSSLDGIASTEHHHHHHHHSHSSGGGDNTILIDRDILLDKLGFRDLDPDITQGEMQEMLRRHISSNGNSLPTLNERMSEETMDDVHAFQNLTFCKRPSTGSSTGSTTVEESSEMMMMAGSAGEDGSSSPERATSKEGYKSLSSPAALQLNTLDEEEEEEEGVDDDDDEDNGSIEEEAGEKCTVSDILDIPDGVIRLREKPILNGKLTSSIATLGVLSSTACGDDDDDNEDIDDDAEVEVPTSIMEELDINEGKRKLLHRDTSLMVVGGSDMDFLEDDEQDGLEADLANVTDEPR